MQIESEVEERMEAKQFLQNVKDQLDQHALFSDPLIVQFENMSIFYIKRPAKR